MDYIKPATMKDALQVLQNIRPEDKSEIEGLGHNLFVLPFCIDSSDVAVSFFTEPGVIGGVAGIMPDPQEGVGQIFMICTPALQAKPVTFVRHARKWITEQEKNYTLLWNLADARNLFHHKLLKLLGFKAVQRVYPPPLYNPYLEIVKLCARQSSLS